VTSGEERNDYLAPEALACPRCHERRVDELVVHDDETVHCMTCGNDYALPEGKEEHPA
jgi:uncharacterized Zn finger protein